MIERKCFVCGGFGHIICNCRNMKSRQKERQKPKSLNKFEVLRSRVMKIGKGSGREIGKDRKMILREEILKEGKKERAVEVRKIKEVKLLNSEATGLVMSSKFARKNKFREKKLDRLIDMRNVDGTN